MINHLQMLIGQSTLGDFNQPFVIHNDVNALSDLRSDPLVKSVHDLLNLWSDKVSVHLPDARDEISSMDVDASEGKKYLNEGMGLLFNDTNRFSELFQDWVEGLRRDLGLSAQTYGRSLIYVTPDGQGTAPHFDQNINFVVQIHGTKKWILSPNTSVAHPMVRHTMGHPVDPEMQSYQTDFMPSEMPKDQTEFELKPGSVLFVPRGVWHQTEAHGEALALNFTFTAPTYTDLFLGALRSRLVLSPKWRETVFMPEDRFDQLLKELVADLPNWKASDILEATEGL